jgi:hypothetical protein
MKRRIIMAKRMTVKMMTSDTGQQMLRQSYTPPASQAVAVSLCDEEALSATGESRDTAIWISARMIIFSPDV